MPAVPDPAPAPAPASPDERGGPRSLSRGARQVLDLLLKSGSLSQADITRLVDLTQPTVARLIQGFHRDGLVTVRQRHVDRPGNPSVQVALNPDYAYSLGVSMLGDGLAMVVSDLTGAVRGAVSEAMPDMSVAKVTERLRAFKARLLAETGVDPARLIGAGVGISGFYSGVQAGFMSPPAQYLREWALRDIAEVLEACLDLPVVYDNDANVAAVAESLYGVGRTCPNFVYLHLTNGFGAGIISHGRAFRGARGNAGELGGVWNLCGDGYPNLDLLKTCLARRGHAFATVEDMVSAIDVDWPGVEDWLGPAVAPFTKLCKILGYTIDPEKVVIGGRLPRSIAEALAGRIDLTSTNDRYGLPYPMPTVVVSELQDSAVALGASAMPLQNAFFL